MRPLLYDIFAGAGGATRGYQLAGFRVVGVDHRVQPRYCGDAFHQLDAFEFFRRYQAGEFEPAACFAASPPCQAYSRATAWRGDRGNHPDLIAATRAALQATGAPCVIENVQEARRLLRDPVLLCGSQFGLRVRRHRYFETHPPRFALLPACKHRAGDYSFDHGGKQPESVYRDALGVPWMTVHEAREAIPPCYTEFLGRQLIAQLA